MSKYGHIIDKISELFPAPLAREIEAISQGRRISEIRIRRRGRSSIVAFGRSIPLSFSGEKYIDNIFMSVCRGTPYAYRDSILKGFVPLFDGVRVGVAGRARYEGDRLVGITDVSSLVFRIPAEKCDFASEIYEIWRRSRGGLLIFSAPGGGKTTALRLDERGRLPGRSLPLPARGSLRRMYVDAAHGAGAHRPLPGGGRADRELRHLHRRLPRDRGFARDVHGETLTVARTATPEGLFLDSHTWISIFLNLILA